MQIHESQLRPLATGLGLGTIAFGVFPLALPTVFASLFGFPARDPATISMMRSIGLRDAVMGMGLWSAAAHGGKYAPWLLARTLTDGGDTVAVAIAAAQSKRNPRLLALGAIALAASASELTLYLATRRARKAA
jgi:hypothetical protein